MQKFFLGILALGLFALTAPAQLVMLKDINTRPHANYGSSPSSYNYKYVEYNGYLYFNATTTLYGIELWVYDDYVTNPAPTLVKDIYSGSSSGYANYITAMGGNVYFMADNGINGGELWKSDGTTSGTVMVKDIRSGSSGSSLSPPY